MSNDSDAPTAHEHLSALADGELDAGAVSSACMAWRDDAASRSTWHAYHLIGDVLRSDDLASEPVRDAEFLRSLRARLSSEPIVLAPASLPSAVAVEQVGAETGGQRRAGASRNSRWSWMAPSAVAAGFVVVAGALMVANPATSNRDTSVASSVQTLGSQRTSGPLLTLPGAAASAFPVSETFAPQSGMAAPNRQLIRDARLDRYLSAHKEFAGSTALGVPSGFLRDAVAESPSR